MLIPMYEFVLGIFVVVASLLLLHATSFKYNNAVIRGLGEAWENEDEKDKEQRRKLVPYPPDFYPGGKYVQLPYGETRYWLFGPEEGKKVVFVHGITIPCTVFRAIARPLAEKGFRVLIYDIYGRGYSASPPVLYDQGLFVTQLAILLRKVGFDRTSVIGLSMGGAISVLFTQQFPEMVEELALLAPAGLLGDQDFPMMAKVVSSVPGAGTMLGSSLVKSLALRLWRNRLPQEDNGGDTAKEANVLLYQFQNHRGFVQSYISTIKHFPLRGLEQSYKDVGRLEDIEVLVFWGTSDTIVPYRLSELLQQHIPRSRLISIPGGSHDIPITHHELITEKLIEFLAP